MRAIKRITALVLVALMTLSLSACIHKKDEIAVTVNDVEFTSAYYMCALINAKMEGQQKVTLTEDEQNGTKEINYFSKKIDKKKYVDWVEDRAIEILKETASYKILCEKNKLKLSEKELTEAKETAAYQWQSYGYSAYFEPNGVSYETFEQFMVDGCYYNLYFDSIYGKEGSKALKAEDVNKEIADNYILVDVLSMPYGEDADDNSKAQAKSLLQSYADEIAKGNKTFAEVYKAYNGIEDTESEEETDDVKPVNTYATIMGSGETDYADDAYDTVKAYAIDTPQVVESADESGVVLYIKRDLNADQYYVDFLDNVARHTLADDEYDKELAKHTKKLKVDKNGYALSQFKVKDIIEPETTY